MEGSCEHGENYPTCIPYGHLHRMTYTRCCFDTSGSPDDEHKVARNMLRLEINTYKRNCASSWLFIRIKTATYVRVVQNVGNLTGCGTICFPRRAVVHGVKSPVGKLVGNKTSSKFKIQSYS